MYFKNQTLQLYNLNHVGLPSERILRRICCCRLAREQSENGARNGLNVPGTLGKKKKKRRFSEDLREMGIGKKQRKLEKCRRNCWPVTVRERCLDR